MDRPGSYRFLPGRFLFSEKPMKDDEKWQFAYEILKDFHTGMIVPTSKFLYSDKGLATIPLNRKQWIKTTLGMELPPNSGVLFLDFPHYKAKDGLSHDRMVFCGKDGATLWKLIWAVVRNTLLIRRLTGKDIKERAVNATIRGYLRCVTTCPINLRTPLAEIAAWVAYALIDEYSGRTTEELTRTTAKDLKFKKSRVVDLELRKLAKETLISHGIKDCRWRDSQLMEIDELLEDPKFAKIEKVGFKKKLIEWLRVNKWLRPMHGGQENRAFEIKKKVANRIALSGKERKFKHDHPELFKN